MNFVLRTHPTITRAADTPIVIEWQEIQTRTGPRYRAECREFGVSVTSARDPIHKCMREIARTTRPFHHQRPVKTFHGDTHCMTYKRLSTATRFRVTEETSASVRFARFKPDPEQKGDQNDSRNYG